MASKYTEEQLNSLDRETLTRLFLSQQEQLENIDHTLQLVLEQMADLKRHRFGRSSEKHEAEGQVSFMEVDGKIVFFNESEAVAAEESTEEPEGVSRTRPKKKQGKREEDLDGIPVVVVEHSMTDEELEDKFGKDGFKQLPDEVYRRYSFTPAKIEVEEHHVKVYAGKETEEVVKAPHPQALLRGSLVSPSLEAAIMNAKYVNAVPLYRQEQEFERYGLHIPRQNMANWTIQCADRYLAVLYDYLHEKLYGYHVLQADETPVLVNKDGRPAGSKSYMWVYRTGRMYTECQIVLYEYQRTRNASHPREFLKDFRGVCVTDGYQVYHTIEEEREDLKIAGCWSHARRRFDEAVKALPKAKQKDSRAYLALTMIQAIYREEKLLKDLPAEERMNRRQLSVKPLVEAYFIWVRETLPKVPQKSRTWEGFNYSLNQEKYLKVFLDDGEVPMDNNAAEQSIRGFCIGKKNWVMIDTIAGAKSSAIIYSIAETAKANNLKPYDYFEYLLTEIPKHLDDTDRSFLDDLLPWSPGLPANCRKPNKSEVK
ncbi:IS66 family transposase [uncultured Faecalibaculum sp.]|uniref:IS66 family transposase n=1 Tax=uncultured Faecalibaculum sp. TaxID=1729681 RepID=UPI00272EA917|nr:IS66 family transposase [uncultured Faecalibaculum sp.]